MCRGVCVSLGGVDHMVAPELVSVIGRIKRREANTFGGRRGRIREERLICRRK